MAGTEIATGELVETHKGQKSLSNGLVMSSCTTEDIKTVIETLHSSFSQELFAKEQYQLEEYWHFSWDDDKSLHWNTYQFFSMLELYKSFCRRWEEHHNGSCCVVDRVRDKYLMPKIKNFVNETVKIVLYS